MESEVIGVEGAGEAVSSTLPGDPRLADVARQLDRARLAAELFDPSWKMVWLSGQLKTLLGEQDESKLGYGEHCLAVRLNPHWKLVTTDETRESWRQANLGYVLHETPTDVLEEMLGRLELPENENLLEGIEPAPAPPSWSFELPYQRPGLPPMRISCLSVRINDSDGSRIGTANVYAPALPATLIDLLARGDEQMFERMSRLIEPGRHPAAILFADLQSSGTLSRRLPSAAFFRVIRGLTTAIDDLVGEFGGIVGKHAGDGVTAFFLADDAGSASAAARAAIEAARGIATGGRLAAMAAAEEGGPVAEEDIAMNIGLHWGGALYMGQVVTGGRLEVTALGDEVNEGARLQQSARDGAILASKSLIEQLSTDDAAALRLDPDGVLYRTISELPGADEKAVRDAGGVAVAAI